MNITVTEFTATCLVVLGQALSPQITATYRKGLVATCGHRDRFPLWALGPLKGPVNFVLNSTTIKSFERANLLPIISIILYNKKYKIITFLDFKEA